MGHNVLIRVNSFSSEINVLTFSSFYYSIGSTVFPRWAFKSRNNHKIINEL